MTAEIATLEKVQAAVDQLHRDGKKATANTVIAVIGGGSKPTVLKHLRALREAPKPSADELPAAVLDLARPVIAQIYDQGVKAEELRHRDQTERYHRLLGDLEAQVEELTETVQAQEARLAEMTANLDGARSALGDATRTMAEQKKEIERLQAALASQNAQAVDHLAGLLQGVEERVATIAGKLDKAASRTSRRAQGSAGKKE